MKRLFTVSNPKTAKSVKMGYLTAILHLRPGRDLCPFSTPGCRASCLNTAGRGAMDTVQRARLERTVRYCYEAVEFPNILAHEVLYWNRRANRKGLLLAVRVNGTSDDVELAMAVERNVRAINTGMPVTFYDYTKNGNAIRTSAHIGTPVHYTFSRSEQNVWACDTILREGAANVAVVFDTRKGESLPQFFNVAGAMYPVIDGDEHDLRFLDPRGVIVGLRAKGRARADTTGFVVRGYSGAR